MESINQQIREIRKMFPHKHDRLEELFEKNEEFRILCTDYFHCKKFLLEYQKEKFQNKGIIAEYEVLRNELEEEIIKFVNS